MAMTTHPNSPRFARGEGLGGRSGHESKWSLYSREYRRQSHPPPMPPPALLGLPSVTTAVYPRPGQPPAYGTHSHTGAGIWLSSPPRYFTFPGLLWSALSCRERSPLRAEHALGLLYRS